MLGGRTIRVVANSFLASGGDNFSALAKGANRADSGRDLAQRSVGVQLSAPANGTAYLPGESVTADLSSLLFSRGGPTEGEASILLGDTVLGSAPVSFAITDAFDEQGAARVTFPIPQDADGTLALTILGPGGTEIPLVLEVAEDGTTDPVRTATLGWPDRLIAWGNPRIDYTVRVGSADGSAPVGTVEIYDVRTVVATIELTEADNGRAEVELPKLGRGIHLLTPVFTGADGYDSSRGFSIPILVL